MNLLLNIALVIVAAILVWIGLDWLMSQTDVSETIHKIVGFLVFVGALIGVVKVFQGERVVNV